MYQQTAICSTLNYVPMTASALQKSRLPFAIHLYPFAQDENIPVSADGLIVRCNVCRAFISPYSRIDEHRQVWQCIICNRSNELPPEFSYDPVSQQYYQLSSKVELTSETVEYNASVDYMVRPPQPACYMILFDCSKAAVELEYIPVMAQAIADTLDAIPGDARASIGFIAYDSNVHYFSFSGTQVVHFVSPDITSTMTPCATDGLLANMTSKREMILDFLTQTLPTFPFGDRQPQSIIDQRSALGPALEAATRIIQSIGGKIIIIQAQLANHGNPKDGSALTKREDPIVRKDMSSDKNADYLTPLISPATDFYKLQSLACCEHQVSVDLFNLATSYIDIASMSTLVKSCAGNLYHYTNATNEQKQTLNRFNQDLRNYLTRTLGLEAVLRLRVSRGLKIHTFHGNFFARSKDLLSLPIANPDSGYALQISFDEDLRPNTRYVFFQASLLYTTPLGERRIRVHTARYPTASTLPEIIYGANQTAVVGMLAKMAVDRSQQASVGEAKEALIGAGIDLLETYALADEAHSRAYPGGLPDNLRLVPLYILALLKHVAFRISPSIKLDERAAAMERFKSLPLDDLITYIYPDMYAIHNIANDPNEDWKQPISLTAALVERNGAYLLDAYDVVIIFVCECIDPRWCYEVFGVQDYRSIVETNELDLPEYDTATSRALRDLLGDLLEQRPQQPKFHLIKSDNHRDKSIFYQYLIEDRSESNYSYAEFWRFLLDQKRS